METAAPASRSGDKQARSRQIKSPTSRYRAPTSTTEPSPTVNDRRETVGNSPEITRLTLHPRLCKSGYRYDVGFDGELIVVGSNDPEHDTARALLALGIAGKAETINANTGMPLMRFDIASFASTRTVERNFGSVTTEPWRPLPSRISHGA